MLAAPWLADLPAALLVVEDEFDSVDAAVVLAGDLNYERTTAAAALIRDGRARLLVLTGGEPGPGDSSSSLAEVALRLGVEERLIRTESVSTSTWSSIQAVKPILEAEGVRSLAVVTSPYHQRRATLTARRLLGPGFHVFAHPARPSWWSPEGWWKTRHGRKAVFSEYLKLVYYSFRRA